MLAPFFFTALATCAKWLHKWQHKITGKKKALRIKGLFCILAERAGFEPAVGCYPTHAFQACDLNHSSTSPKEKRILAEGRRINKILS